MQRRIHILALALIAVWTGLALASCAQIKGEKCVEIDGHRFIDLQLPSGTLWAETNLGADSDTDFGNQYAWGELKPKADYSQATYCYGTDFEKMVKYNDADHKNTLSPDDDAATELWGKNCRMPTQKEMEELGDSANCTWTWMENTTGKSDIARGYEVKSVRNGNTIFLPAAGAHNGKDYLNDDQDGLYWTSTLAPRSNGEAWCLYFNLGHYSYYMNERRMGASIRPVAQPSSNKKDKR